LTALDLGIVQETHDITLTFSDGSIRRITDSVGKGHISAAVGKMIRDDEIRPIYQQQRAYDNDYSYRDQMNYDVNKDPTLRSKLCSSESICWCDIWRFCKPPEFYQSKCRDGSSPSCIMSPLLLVAVPFYFSNHTI
jgi:hypothetical protein